MNCRNYRASAPENWKPSYKGQEFTVRLLREHLGAYPKWNAGWPGKCMLQPVAVDVRSSHGCGQWSVNDEFLQSWWMLSTDHQMAEEIHRLKQELKAVQKTSLDRYHRLRQMAKRSAGRRPTQQPASSIAPPDPDAQPQANGATQ